MEKPVLEFKSDPYNYRKEKLGIKNNTLRKVDLSDDRFVALKDIQVYLEHEKIIGWILELKKAGFDNPEIMISNTATNEYFVREIKDITHWCGWVIITWRT